MLCARSRPGRADGGRGHLRSGTWLDGPGSTLPGRTGNQVGATVAVSDY